MYLVSSGVGKTSVIREITKQRPNIEKVITSTTREMRPEEKNGVDYYFYSKDEFERMLQNDDFFQSNMSYDNYYGSEKKKLREYLILGILHFLLVTQKTLRFY